MPYPSRRFSPSLESVGPAPTTRTSLFDNRDEFIERVSPIGMAAIYFGSFSFAPQDAALSRQALFKLSFAYRYFLQPAGVKIAVTRQTALLSGAVTGRYMTLFADILAHQIEGVEEVTDETELPDVVDGAGLREIESTKDRALLLFATDQTLQAGFRLSVEDEKMLLLEGNVKTLAQKIWAESLVTAAGGEFISRLNAPPIPGPVDATRPADVDDESLQALVLFRLRLVRETEHLHLRVKANRGIFTIQGKVRSEALRQRVENITRSTIGLRELRSSLTIAP